MFRKKTAGDITTNEYSRYVKPHFDMIDKYLYTYVVPDFCAYFIFSSYNHHCEEESFDTFIQIALTSFNLGILENELKLLKRKIKSILKLKYKLLVKNEKPLELKNCFPELLKN